MLNQNLQKRIVRFESDFQLIDSSRRELLAKVAQWIKAKVNEDQPINLIFICTHNSRRSHISQLWAQATAANYKIPGVATFSGGTEATAFNPRAVQAMKRAGFDIRQVTFLDNPIYEVGIGRDEPVILASSKKYDSSENPHSGFAAIMTCSDADENCPVVIGAEARFKVTYEDPKRADGQADESKVYDDTVTLIGREMTFLMNAAR